jgi:glucokinase
MPYPRFLTVDAGGTNIRQVEFEERGDGRFEQTADPVVTACSSVLRLEDAITDFVGANRIDAVGIAAAGPVNDGVCRFTNLPWVVDRASVAAALKLQARSVAVVNDLEACMYGIDLLPPESFYVLHPGREGATGNRAVISAGTGLGEAGETFDFLTGTRHPYATEGGHCPFAPSNSGRDFELLRYFSLQGKDPTWEDMVSGNGLYRLWEFVRDFHSRHPHAGAIDISRCADRPAEVSRLALAHEDRYCELALSLFVYLYGCEARNLALKTGAKSAFFIAGDIAVKNLARFKADDTFMRAFLYHQVPNIGDLLAGIPVKIVLTNANLIGAARVAQSMFKRG